MQMLEKICLKKHKKNFFTMKIETNKSYNHRIDDKQNDIHAYASFEKIVNRYTISFLIYIMST